MKMNKKGFTLIELLIVVAIIAILAAIAIPQFAQYRIRGYNASANSDIRNCRTSQEALFADWQRYAGTQLAALPGAGTAAGAVIAGPGTPAAPTILSLTDSVGTARGIQIAVGNNVDLHAAATAVTFASYTVISKHLQGDTTFGADSDSTTNYKDAALIAVGTHIVGQLPAPVAGTDQFNGVGGWIAM
jgi:type IV pilus assembly protein PilA